MLHLPDSAITVSHHNDRDTKLVELDAALNVLAVANLVLRAIVRFILRISNNSAAAAANVALPLPIVRRLIHSHGSDVTHGIRV